MGKHRREGGGRRTRGLLCSAVQASALGCPGSRPRRSLPARCWLGTRRVVGFPSCARDCWRREFRARDFPDCAGAGLGPSDLLATSDTGVVPPRCVTYSWGKCSKWDLSPPQARQRCWQRPRDQRRNNAQWRSPPFAGEQTGASAKPEEMILRPQSRGDLGVPIHKGTKPFWRSWDQPASPAGRRLILFCALSGYNQGVMLDLAQRTESGVMMQQPC